MDLSYQIWLCIGFIVYYSTLQMYSEFTRVGLATNNKNRTIESLRTKYKVTIKTFRSNNVLLGFAWFKTVWIAERVLANEKALLYTFHHEHYHVKKKHKFWILFMRFIISLSPLTIYFVNWLIFIGILLLMALLSQKIIDVFEKKANDYAINMIRNVKSKGEA